MTKFCSGQVGRASSRTKAFAAFVVLAFGAAVLSASSVAADSTFIPGDKASPPPSGAQNLCVQYVWACAPSQTASMSSGQELKLVKQINRHVNSRTRSVSDQSQYKTREYWALPTSRGGDCEDFALLKKHELIRAGMDPSKLLIATVLDKRRNAHAVLVYRSDQGDLVLDNLTDRIKPWNTTRYMFLRMQNPQQPNGWLGIYRNS